MAQNFLDRLDESVGMEEYDLGRDISDAATQRGISSVEMRAQLIQTMLQEDGKTISDKDRDLYALGEISLAEAVKRSTVDRTLKTDVKALTGKMQKGIAGLRPKIEDFQEYITGVPSYIDAKAGMGRTLSDLDQVTEVDALQELAADSGRTLSDMDRQLVTETIGLAPLRKGPFLPRRVSGFRNHLQDVLAKSGATISDADRELLQGLIASPVDPLTLSDRDRQIIQDIQGRTLSNSDAAILEMLK
jgi:hypothetical protein